MEGAVVHETGVTVGSAPEIFGLHGVDCLNSGGGFDGIAPSAKCGIDELLGRMGRAIAHEKIAT